MELKTLAAVTCTALLAAGCAGSPVETLAPPSRPQVSAQPPAHNVYALVGSWGVASYRDDKDRPRTEAQARAQCKNPYVIARGATDGVMMHVADDPKLYELTFKGAPGGKTYLGFNAPPGDPQDREVLSFSENLVVMRFVAPDINTRYGTYIYVRCSAAARRT